MTEPTPSVSPQDEDRLQRIARLAREGASGVRSLVDELTDPSWTVRRGVVAALARQGDAAVAPLCKILTHRRDNETRVAAAVDALVLCRGDVESALFALSDHPNPAVVCDVAQILGRRRSGPGIPLLTRLTAHPDDNVAVAAIEALGHIGGRATVAALISAASSGNFFRTFPAIDVLGRSGDPEAVPPLLALMAQPVYVLEAVRALGRTGDERVIQPLIELLLRPGDALLRTIVLALVEIHSLRVVRYGQDHVVADALRAVALPASLGQRLAACVADADPAERAALCRVLGWMGGEESIARLLELLRAQPDVAQAAADALSELGQTADAQMQLAIRTGDSQQRLAVLPLLGRRSAALHDTLLCLEDADPAVRAAACETLGRIGETSAVGALFARLADGDPKVAQAALGAIQSLGSPQTEELAIQAAHAADPKVRRAALRIIAYFGYPRGLEALLAAMAEPDERLRDAAIYGLPFIENPRALEALLAAAAHESPRTRAAAMRALGQADRTEAVTARLRAGLGDADAWVRYYAVQSLGKLRDEGAAEAVIRLLEDPAGQVQVAVVDALACLNTEGAAHALYQATSSPDPDVQRAALLGLGVARRPGSLPVLLQAFEGPEPATRLVALSAVAEFDAPEVVPVLLRAARDADEGVRNAAVGFLAARPGPGATQQLIGLLSDAPLREVVLRSLALPVEGRIPGLLAELQSADGQLAPLLVGALARMHRADASAAILEALRSAGPEGRRAAAQAVGTWRTAAAKAALERAAREDPDAEIRRLCTLALVP